MTTLDPAVRAQAHWVYRNYSTDGELLYIGCTLNPLGRMQTHHAKAHWWPVCASTTWQQYPNYEAARKAEKAAIIAEQPTHNRQRGPRYRHLRAAS